MSVRLNILALQVRVRVEDDRYLRPARFNETHQPARVVGVPIGQDDRVQLICLYLQNVHVVEHAVDGHTCIEQK